MVIFGNDDPHPPLPSKAEGPASEVYRLKEDLAAAFAPSISPSIFFGLQPAMGTDSFSRMSNASLPALMGKRVTLRRPREEDFEARLRLGTDAEIFRMYGGNRSDLRPMTEEVARRWLGRLLDHDYAWIIEAGSLIGHVRLDSVDLRDKRASLAIGIDDSTQLGKGLGSEAVVLVLGYAFNVLELHRVSVRVVHYNLRAIRAYQKCGFVVEGREREAAFVDGMWYDDVMMAILDREYAEIQCSKA